MKVADLIDLLKDLPSNLEVKAWEYDGNELEPRPVVGVSTNMINEVLILTNKTGDDIEW